MADQLSIVDKTANPAPLGLMGFGMTTVLLNLHNANIIALSAMILGMGIFYGGIAQVIAGIMEWKKGNTFATTAFTSYGMFWLVLVTLWLLPDMGFGKAPAADDAALTAFLFMWGLFTFVLFIGTFKLSRALQVVFGTLTILFFLLAYEHTIPGDNPMRHTIGMIAGYEGIFCGMSAIYTGLAQVLNEVYGKKLLPL
jgi:succinate-acetate transporter protein